MNILTANVAFGLRDMDKLLPNLRAHLVVHGLGAFTGRTTYIRKRTDLDPILALADRLDPDALVLNEVMVEIQGPKILAALRARGFASTAWAMGEHYPDARIATLIASKDEGTAVSFTLPQRPRMSGAASMGMIRLTRKRVSIIGLHLSLGSPELWKRQVRAAIAAAAEERRGGNAVILAGDWNRAEADIFGVDGFRALQVKCADAAETPTCPTFLPRRMKPVDHIFVPNSWNSMRAEPIRFGSDHAALFAEIESSTGE